MNPSRKKNFGPLGRSINALRLYELCARIILSDQPPSFHRVMLDVTHFSDYLAPIHDELMLQGNTALYLPSAVEILRRPQHQHAFDALSEKMLEVFGVASQQIVGLTVNCGQKDRLIF